MSTCRLTRLANDDLCQIRDRVLRDNGPGVARRIVAQLDEKLALLCKFPGMGRARPELTDEPVFFLPFYCWLVVYDPESQPLEILRFVSARRSIKDLL